MHISSHSPDLINRNDAQPTLSSLSNGTRQSNNPNASATDKMLEKLAQHIPGMNGAQSFNQLDAKDFSPQKVADRVTDFVAMGLEQARLDGKSEAEVEKLRQAAMTGIQKGITEARNILDNMNLLTEEVSATIDETLKLTLQGLEGLIPGAAPQSVSGNSTSMLAAERYQSAESLSLKVKTQDGDEVTIRFNKESDYQSSFGGYSDDQGSAVSFSIDRSESSNYRFSVEGDLDSDEIDALQNLIKDINEIAGDFFDGDVQAAFDQASAFKMDKTELASMNLRLTRSESYSAITAYEQVQNQGNQQDGGRKLGHMLNGLADQVGSPALGFMESPFDFGKELISGLISQDQRYKEADEEHRSLFEQHLDSMRSILDNIALAAKTDHEELTGA